MAIDQLGLYNNALTLIGQTKLAGLTEDRESRYYLDDAWELDAVKYCLEIVKPRFATKTAKLDTPDTSDDHDLDSVHDLPDDYITLVGFFSDSKLDNPISRFILDAETIACEYDTAYLRYISDDFEAFFGDWTASFARVVAAYLAREICLKINPAVYEAIDSLFTDRVNAAIQLDTEREPGKRSSAPTVTLNNSWRLIYNDALLIMGLPEIVSNNDDSNRKTKLDRALDAGIVADLLEDTGWTFALKSTRGNYDPGVEPPWGYPYAFDHPSDMHRLHGIYYDEYMTSAIKDYKDEQGYFFVGVQTIYIQYVSTDWLTNPISWPTFFRRLVAARMARDAAPSLKNEGADVENAIQEFQDRKNAALSNDAMAAPPRKLGSGRWLRGRYRQPNRGRP